MKTCLKRLVSMGAFAAVLALAACGGGGDGGGSGGGSPTLPPAATGGEQDVLLSAQPAPNGAQSEIQLVVRPGSTQAPATALAATDADAFMDWAEIKYPQYFPGAQAAKPAGSFTYRFYPGTRTYLAIRDGIAYVVTAPGNVLVSLGPTAQFACAVFPESCATADAGPAQAVAVGSKVQLSGTGSKASGTATLSYTWTLTSKPGGSGAMLSSTTTATPTFVADAAGRYQISLTVKDSHGATASATTFVTAAVADIPPTARPGSSQSVVRGSIVSLNGSASSDPAGKPLSYTWTLVSKPQGSAATLSGANTQAIFMTADASGRFEIHLVVSNGVLSSAPAAVFIDVTDSAPPSIITPSLPPGPSCCKVCSTGKACGDSCISKTFSCTKGPGCAC